MKKKYIYLKKTAKQSSKVYGSIEFALASLVKSRIAIL